MQQIPSTFYQISFNIFVTAFLNSAYVIIVIFLSEVSLMFLSFIEGAALKKQMVFFFFFF